MKLEGPWKLKEPPKDNSWLLCSVGYLFLVVVFALLVIYLSTF